MSLDPTLLPPPGSAPLPRVHACTMVRNSCAQLFSWVAFHHQLGVSSFTLYDIDTQDCSREVLRDYIESGIVTMVRWPGEGASRYATKAFRDMSVCPKIEGFDRNGCLRQSTKIPLRSEACPRWRYSEMLKLCQGQVSLTNYGHFDLSGLPFNWEWCQTSAMADCVAHQRDNTDFLGFFDVDEYMFPATSHTSLPQTIQRLNLTSEHTQIAVEGLIYGHAGRYAPLAATDVVPSFYRRHSSLEMGSASSLAYLNAARTVRTYAVKSFYRFPHALRGEEFAVEVHTNRPLHSPNVLLQRRDSGMIRYNHYMLRSIEDLSLATQLIASPEKRPSRDVLLFFNAVANDTRMEHFLPSFLRLWDTKLLPVLRARLAAFQTPPGGVHQASEDELRQLIEYCSPFARGKAWGGNAPRCPVKRAGGGAHATPSRAAVGGPRS